MSRWRTFLIMLLSGAVRFKRTGQSEAPTQRTPPVDVGALPVDWSQDKPWQSTAEKMCRRVTLTPLTLESQAVSDVLGRLRVSHSNGGAVLAGVRVGESETFDWFASRNRLMEYGILLHLLSRQECRNALTELLIPAYLGEKQTGGCFLDDGQIFTSISPLVLDSELAQILCNGGAYSTRLRPAGTGVEAKRNAAAFWNAIFHDRYEDVDAFRSHHAWTPWFGAIAWDWTAVVFDKRERALWVFAVTDTD